jgi:hypothetical protein
VAWFLAAWGSLSPPAPCGATVRFEDDRLHVDGAPFFPYGFFWFDPDDAPALREHHFNVVYTGSDPKLLEIASANGLKSFSKPTNEAWIRRVATNSDVVAWFLRDDADTPSELEACRSTLDRLRRIDRDRPAFANVNGRRVDLDKPFAELLDVYAPYMYPFPRMGLDEYATFLDTLRTGVGRPVLWTTVQAGGIYSQNRFLGFTDEQMSVMLDPAQLRLLVWTAISHGARGVLFWPDYALFNDRGWGSDCREEAAIIGCELEIVGGFLVEGREVRAGAAAAPTAVRVTRVDRGDETIALVTVSGPRYHYAVDAAVARDVRLSIEAPASPAARAFAVSFPEIRELPITPLRGGVEVRLEEVETTEIVLLTSHEETPAAIEAGLTARLPEVSRRAVALATAYVAEASWVLEQLSRLGALPSDLAARWAELRDHDVDPALEADPVARYRSARRRVRGYRDLLAACRDRADAFIPFADPDAVNFRMSPATLPAYFSSFDVESGGEGVDPGGGR